MNLEDQKKVNELLTVQAISQISASLNMLDYIAPDEDKSEWFIDCLNILKDRFNLFAQIAMEDDAIAMMSVELIMNHSKKVEVIGEKASKLKVQIESKLKELHQEVVIESHKKDYSELEKAQEEIKRAS